MIERSTDALSASDPEAIKAAVHKYLNGIEITGGATAEQAAQIEQNRQDISALTQRADSGEFNGEQGPQGSPGETGAAGADGYTPVRGTDYWTESDIAEIKAYVDNAILGGQW